MFENTLPGTAIMTGLQKLLSEVHSSLKLLLRPSPGTAKKAPQSNNHHDIFPRGGRLYTQKTIQTGRFYLCLLAAPLRCTCSGGPSVQSKFAFYNFQYKPRLAQRDAAGQTEFGAVLEWSSQSGRSRTAILSGKMRLTRWSTHKYAAEWHK
jgi:hypothetical protein